MQFDSRILSLPASILLLMVSQTFATQHDRNEQSPAHHLTPDQDFEVVEYVPRGRSPLGVMKMSSDAGEKFYHEYWQFGQDQGGAAKLEVPLQARQDAGLLANVSTPFRAPLALHTEHQSSYDDLKARKVLEGRNAAAVLGILQKRDFICPTGYLSCSGINYPNSCCSTTETCFVIEDTGLGPVGCCPNGSTCGGTITTCGAINSPCADSLGGGCCIPNYVCAGVGCVANSSVVTTVITQVFTVTIYSSSTQLTTVVIVSTSTSTSTSISNLIPSTTSSVPKTSSTTSTTPTRSTATGVAPVRPTSITSSDTATTATEMSCPVGFYGCSAHYQGGCCRTGRNCDTTSCPVIDSTTIISSGVTVVVPVGSAATLTSPTGACATGWSSCAASVGGNCCPTGWDCGTASCSSVGASSTAVEQKASPNVGSASSRRAALGVISGLGAAFCLGILLS